jgi:hypothetical protein
LIRDSKGRGGQAGDTRSRRAARGGDAPSLLVQRPEILSSTGSGRAAACARAACHRRVQPPPSLGAQPRGQEPHAATRAGRGPPRSRLLARGEGRVRHRWRRTGHRRPFPLLHARRHGWGEGETRIGRRGWTGLGSKSRSRFSPFRAARDGRRRQREQRRSLQQSGPARSWPHASLT